MKEGGVYHHDPDPPQEGEWRLGCPVEHHKQGVHSTTMTNQIVSMKNQYKDDMKKKK